MADESFDPTAVTSSNTTTFTTDENTFPDRATLEEALGTLPSQEERDLMALPPEERAIGAKLLPGLVSRISEMAEANKGKKLAEEVASLRAQNDKMMREELAKFRARQEPPDEKALEKLLSQEYASMTVKVFTEDGEREFSITELPQTAEKRLITVLQKSFLPYLKELQSVEWTKTATVGEKIQKIIDAVPQVLDTLADLAVIALDPRQKDASITREWVQENMNSNRMIALLEAQILVGKIRDFISAAFRLIPQ